MYSERRLYEILKECYTILEVDENVDDISLKKAYRAASKKYHPDANPNDEQAEEKFKKVSEAYTFLNNENNRKLYKKLKEKYENFKQREYSRRQSSKFYKDEEKVKENENKYIFQRRDGSKVEIQPLDKHYINGQKICKYRVIQYCNNMTIINDVYGRINLSELLKTVEYCDFCVNNLLSKNNIDSAIKVYNGYIGYVEMAYKNGRKHYKVCDRDSIDNYDLAMDIYSLRNKEDEINIETEDYDIWLEKLGKVIFNGKALNQYLVFEDNANILNLVYSENIDIYKIKNNRRYHNAVSEKLLDIERLKQKNKEGGYISQLLYNVDSDGYDIVIDKEIEKVLNVKQKNRV